MTQGVALGWLVFAPLVLLGVSPWAHIRSHRKNFRKTPPLLPPAHGTLFSAHNHGYRTADTADTADTATAARQASSSAAHLRGISRLASARHPCRSCWRTHSSAPAANLKYADLLNFLGHLLASYIEEESLGELYRTSVAVRLSPRETFMPDLSFFTNAQVMRLPETHAPFAPTWVCEVLSRPRR